MRDVIHHVADEETMLLANAESVLDDRLGEIGARMMKRRAELMTEMAPRAVPAAGLVVGAAALLALLLTSARWRRA